MKRSGVIEMSRKKKYKPTPDEVEELIDEKIDCGLYRAEMSESALDNAYEQCYSELIEEYEEEEGN